MNRSLVSNVTDVKRGKIFRKFISRKTGYPRCNYGSPVMFMGRIWRPGDHLWTVLPLLMHWSYSSLILSQGDNLWRFSANSSNLLMLYAISLKFTYLPSSHVAFNHNEVKFNIPYLGGGGGGGGIAVVFYEDDHILIHKHPLWELWVNITFIPGEIDFFNS